MLRSFWPGSRGIPQRCPPYSAKQRDPDFPLPILLGQLVRKNPKAFPGQPRDIVPPPCPGSSSGPPPGGMCPEHLTRRHPNKLP
ncbi:hypothetical protein CHARACLAT_002542 [Characodon lateralis]|uniref:Uncharacterized protein n=1 Tax=Characodon lateralis TaxID=208331 RepID=A0ABU7D411_9TELE|nr:hypothetical protein [Characodon lateralis]